MAANDLGLALARFGWVGSDELGGHSFFANSTGAFRSYVSFDGAGSYRREIGSYAGTRWHVEGRRADITPSPWSASRQSGGAQPYPDRG